MHITELDIRIHIGQEMILMEKYLFHSISNSENLGIVTVLDYEI
mgnify:FL=1